MWQYHFERIYCSLDADFEDMRVCAVSGLVAVLVSTNAEDIEELNWFFAVLERRQTRTFTGG